MSPTTPDRHRANPAYLVLDRDEHNLLTTVLAHFDGAYPELSAERTAVAEWGPALAAAESAAGTVRTPLAFRGLLVVEVPSDGARVALARVLDLLAQAVGLRGEVFGMPGWYAHGLAHHLTPETSTTAAAA